MPDHILLASKSLSFVHGVSLQQVQRLARTDGTREKGTVLSIEHTDSTNIGRAELAGGNSWDFAITDAGKLEFC